MNISYRPFVVTERVIVKIEIIVLGLAAAAVCYGFTILSTIK